jgi:hypothetical protein
MSVKGHSAVIQAGGSYSYEVRSYELREKAWEGHLCYVSMACITRLEQVQGDGYLGVTLR